tara:strand:- start:1388 stop:1786 length:399 start_codon:yes stop_codon:yes gene_type:complete
MTAPPESARFAGRLLARRDPSSPSHESQYFCSFSKFLIVEEEKETKRFQKEKNVKHEKNEKIIENFAQVQRPGVASEAAGRRGDFDIADRRCRCAVVDRDYEFTLFFSCTSVSSRAERRLRDMGATVDRQEV